MAIKLKKKLTFGLTLIAGIACIAASQTAALSAAHAVKEASSYSVAKNGGIYYSNYSSKEECLEAGEALNEEMAGEGMVLLKNKDNTLPLTDVKKISIFGKNSVDPAYSGGGSGGAKGSRDKVDLYEAFANAGFDCNPALKDFYEREDRSGISRQTLQDIFAGPVDIGEAKVSLYDSALKQTFKAYSDAAVVVITRMGSEGSDNGTSFVMDHDGDPTETAQKSYHYNKLSKNETDMIDLVKASGFKNIIVVLNTPSAMEIKDLKDDDDIGGIIWAGQPGYHGFNALGKILNGTLSPSGHLSDTFMADMTKDPTWANFGDGSQNAEDGMTAMNELLDKDGNPVPQGTGDTVSSGDEEQGGGSSFAADEDRSLINKKNSPTTGGTMTDSYTMAMYEEGIYYGYRYYETKYKTNIEELGTQAAADEWYENAVTYPFGFGLSYTNFSTTIKSSNAGALDADGDVTVTVEVENTGSVAGKHVVQLYYEAPYINGEIEKSAKVLGCFAKTDVLKPGEKQELTLTMKAQHMASYDDTDANGDGHKGYEMDQGTYNIYISKNAHELDDGVTAALEYTLAANSSNTKGATDFDNDGYTTNHVENRFVGEYSTLPAEGSGVVFTPMTRAKSADGHRLITPEAPTADERKDLTGDITAALNKVFYLYQLEDENSTDPRKRTEADVKAAFGDDYTQAADASTRTFTKQLKDMAGVDKNDPLWNTVMNEFTWDELVNLVLDGSQGTGVSAEFGKTGTNDSDGPIGISQVMYQDGPLTTATFNLDLATRQGDMVADEALWLGVNGWRGAGFNIHRSPFNGRNFEYYSEDPLLAGMIGAYVVKAANAKGFVSYNKHCGLNEQETGRSGLITYVSEQAIREIYIRPFQLACEVGHSNAFMTSMGRFGLVEAYSNYQFNIEIMRNEWGFDGVLITDALNGGTPTTSKANMQSFSVSGQDIQMANAPDQKYYKFWGTWDASKGVPVYTADDNSTVDLWSAYYWTRVAAKNMLYVTANSNLIKNGYDLAAFAAKEFEHCVGYAVSENLGAGLNLGTNNVHYTLSSGELPAGLTLGEDGTLTGNLTAAGTYKFTVQLAVDGWCTTTAEFTYIVDSVVSYAGDDMASAQVGTAFKGQLSTPLTAEDGFVRFEVDEDSELPAGLTLTDDGAISGTPTAAGTYTFVLNAVAEAEEEGSSGTSIVEKKYPTTFTMTVGSGSQADAAAEAKAAAEAAQKTADEAKAAAEAAQKAADAAAEAAAAKKSGCGGSVIAATSALGAVTLIGAALALKKKKED